jgi:hypothetical protein
VPVLLRYTPTVGASVYISFSFYLTLFIDLRLVCFSVAWVVLVCSVLLVDFGIALLLY